LAFLVTALPAQLTVKQDRVIEDLVKDVLLGKGVVAKSVRYTGMPAALGEFSFPDARSFFPSGIVLSTGKATDMASANDNPKTSTVNGSAGDKNLYALAGGRTFDAAILEFDFMADKDSIAFNFIFASEEYNDYVGSTFNDAFALVITGPGMPAGKNFAVLPGTTSPITVNSINPNQNRQYYVDNNPFTLVGKINEQVKANLNPEVLNNFAYDGMTKVFSVGCRVQPKQVYHFQMSIADAGDGTVDSAVLLEGNSLKSHEQYKHVLRRQQLAEERRQDSLARVKVLEDSLRMATEIRLLKERMTQDSISRAQQHRQDSLRALQAQPDNAPVEETEEEADEESDEETIEDAGEIEEAETPDLSGAVKVDLKDAVIYEGESYLLPPASEGKIKDYGRMLSQNPKLKLGIYLPNGDAADVISMRYDLIRLELIKAGARSQQIFRNGFSHTNSGSVHRAEIWIREE
ncbi:MAG TPA: choice-of-anchor L domain-containing protein, partial [Bacteroidia bacterium]|nr:choice-of-anchor L domain-containing protein [Bacteroidia bacterium]